MDRVGDFGGVVGATQQDPVPKLQEKKKKKKRLRKQSREGRERRCERRCVEVERDEWICFAPQQKNASAREMQWDNIEESRGGVASQKQR